MKNYKITKEQILHLSEVCNTTTLKELKQLFPEVFGSELEVGMWYKSCIGTLAFYSDNKENYGINAYGDWVDELILKSDWDIYAYKIWEWEKATPEEVEQALIKEAEKRGYKDSFIYCIEGYIGSESLKLIGDYKYEKEKNRLIIEGGDTLYTVFKDGVWAEIIPTITKQEAEEKLKCKIV